MEKEQGKSESSRVQMSMMVDDNGIPSLELKGETRNAVSAWLFSFILAVISRESCQDEENNSGTEIAWGTVPIGDKRWKILVSAMFQGIL